MNTSEFCTTKTVQLQSKTLKKPISQTKEYKDNYNKNYDYDTPYEEKDYEGEFNLLNAERELICKSLIKSEGNQDKASILMKVNIRTFYRQIKRHQLESFLKEVLEERKNKKPIKMHCENITKKVRETLDLVEIQIQDNDEMLDVLNERLIESEKKEIELNNLILKDYKESAEKLINCLTIKK